MRDEFILITLMLLILFLIISNSHSNANQNAKHNTQHNKWYMSREYMGSGPEIFNPEGYGEMGTYYDNNNIEPVYREIRIPTIFDTPML